MHRKHNAISHRVDEFEQSAIYVTDGVVWESESIQVKWRIVKRAGYGKEEGYDPR